jgi:hypothetical protein
MVCSLRFFLAFISALSENISIAYSAGWAFDVSLLAG